MCEIERGIRPSGLLVDIRSGERQLSRPVPLFLGNLQVQLNGRSVPALGRDSPVIAVSPPTPTGFSGKQRTPEECRRQRDDECECPQCPWCAQGQHSGSMNSAKASRCQDHHQDDRFAWPANAAMPAPAWRNALLGRSGHAHPRSSHRKHASSRCASTSNQRSGVFTRGLFPGKLPRPLRRRCCAGNRW